jgi:sugar (pentulose or hexulose) kinase
MALGAAIWAGLGAGVFQNYRDAIGRMVHIEETVAPEPECHEAYERLYRQYVDLYPALRPAMHALARQGAAPQGARA